MPNNTYVVASNANFRTAEPSPAGGWRDRAEPWDLLHTRIYTGNWTLLERAMAALQGEFSILETRLDANNGLHVQFLEAIQRAALAHWQQNLELQWMYWCSPSHVEWHWMDPWQRQKNERDGGGTATTMLELLADMVYAYGALVGVRDSAICITLGLRN